MILARATLLACLAAGAAACVPRGDPPAGRQLVADRTSELAGFVRSNGDGLTRVLVARAAGTAENPQLFDLYVVSVDLDAPDAPPVERLLAADVSQLFGQNNCGGGTEGCTDARGRLFVATDYDPVTFSNRLARIDPVTGDRFDLGVALFFTLSANGSRLLVPDDGGTTLYEADDRAIVLPPQTYAQFVGDDLYYLSPQQELVRIKPGGAPERLATGLSGFNPQVNDEVQLVLLTRPTSDPMVWATSILDLATLEETPSPFGTAPFALSPNGRWFYTIDQGTGRVTFLERATGTRDMLEFPALTLGGFEWRPGHDEIWFPTGDYQNPKVVIKQPGGPAVEIPGSAGGPSNELGFGSLFTSDGAYWFSNRASLIEKPMFQIGSADTPAGPRFDLAPAGTNIFQYWRFADGRILSPAFIKSPYRNDLYVVDPATGESGVLGEAGLVIAVGQTRLLACLHVNDGRGDLTVVDPATGRATVLAPEFALAGGFVERSDADRVAPGARVAYQFQARFDSPYDGLWIATIP